MLIDALLLGGLLPALVAGALLFAAARFDWPWLAPIAVASAYAAAHWMIAGAPDWPPAIAHQKLIWLAAGAAGLAAFEASLRTPLALRWLLRAVAAVAIPLWLLGDAASPARVVVAAAGALGLWLSADRGDDIDPRFELFALGASAAAGAAALLLSATALVSQLQGALAATVALMFLVAWRSRRTARRAMPAIALLLIAQWTIGTAFAELPPIAAGLLAGGPIAVGIAAALRRNRRWLLALTGLAALAAGGANWLAYQHDAGRSSGPSDGSASQADSPAGDYDYDYGYD